MALKPAKATRQVNLIMAPDSSSRVTLTDLVVVAGSALESAYEKQSSTHDGNISVFASSVVPHDRIGLVVHRFRCGFGRPENRDRRPLALIPKDRRNARASARR